MPPKVAVLGAGVIGLSSALRLTQEMPQAEVTVIAESFDSDTTSSGAAGTLEPHGSGCGGKVTSESFRGGNQVEKPRGYVSVPSNWVMQMRMAGSQRPPALQGFGSHTS